MQPSIGSTEISVAELEALLEHARQEPLRDDSYQKLRNAVRTLGLVTELLEKQETTLAELRELLCPASTEKTAKVLERAGINSGEKKLKPERKKPAVGHGRNGAAAYDGARRIQVGCCSAAVRISAPNSTSGCAISSAITSKPFGLTFSRKPSSNSGNTTRPLGQANSSTSGAGRPCDPGSSPCRKSRDHSASTEISSSTISGRKSSSPVALSRA
jgi:hypothetical protein